MLHSSIYFELKNPQTPKSFFFFLSCHTESKSAKQIDGLKFSCDYFFPITSIIRQLKVELSKPGNTIFLRGKNSFITQPRCRGKKICHFFVLHAVLPLRLYFLEENFSKYINSTTDEASNLYQLVWEITAQWIHTFFDQSISAIAKFKIPVIQRCAKLSAKNQV